MKTMLFAALCAASIVAAVPSASATTGFTWTESPVTVAPDFQFDPAISGPYVVYTDTAAGTADVYYADRTTGSIHPVATGPGDQQLADVSGNLVTYTSSNGGPADIFLYDINTGTRTQITTSPADELNSAVSNRIVAYENYASGNSDICWYDLLTSATSCLSASGDQVAPSVSGTRIAYLDQNAGASVVVVYDTSTGVSQTISAGLTGSVDIDRSTIAFAHSTTAGFDVSVDDISGSGGVKTLSLPGDQVNPHISGDWVSFEDLATGVSHLALWNYVTGEIEHPNVSSSWQALNDIDGNHVVYTDGRNGNQDIYALEFVPPADAAGQVGGLIGDVIGLALPKGTQTSLLAKLYDAQAALKVGNTSAACSDLASFISETSAQSGKKISASDAAALVTKAQQIEASIPC